ncbi:acyl-CoA dehydrogenase family protein [Nocardioides sp. YIM 152315]|uniref:acyl-CoA dehydrogenase family protein n=1 Tax=Nocardioides sp. YIM 152315 TaxID=3031760 RepID=UPI0023DA7C03|nr:acyl-CoA dehydrogenase family protein [Nocardioides sp. YIM 152315]MDF1604688.1 acyl-CoA/acyl-ACP dehydrogenase [Nocardioides sp. YIM 152315]
MRLVPTEEERDLAAMLRQLFADHCPVAVVRGLREPGADRFPKRLWDELTRAGVLELPFAERHDGAGGGLVEVGVLAREAGRALCPSIVLGTLGLGLAVDALGDDALRDRLLPGVGRGETRGVAAVASPWDAGDLAPTLSATTEGAGWRVSGVVRYVVDADLADLVLATALTPEGRTVGVLLRPGDTGRVEQLRTSAGDRYARLHVDATIPAADVLPDLDPEAVRRVALTLRALACVELVGVTEAILDRTVEYVRGREQFGRPIASFQAAQHLVADIHIGLQAARLTALSAAYRLGRGEVATRETAIAVLHTAEAARRASLDAHQLHGGMGYVLETDLHLWSERARELGVLGGGPDQATRWLEREVVDAPA